MRTEKKCEAKDEKGNKEKRIPTQNNLALSISMVDGEKRKGEETSGWRECQEEKREDEKRKTREGMTESEGD